MNLAIRGIDGKSARRTPTPATTTCTKTSRPTLSPPILRSSRGEILFGKFRPYFHKVCIAAVDGVCSTEVLVIVPTAPQWHAFVLGHISSDAMIAHTNAASTGTKMPRTNWGDIARFEIVVTDERIAAAYESGIAPIFARIAANIHEARPPAAARDRLLPRLLSQDSDLEASTLNRDN